MSDFRFCKVIEKSLIINNQTCFFNQFLLRGVHKGLPHKIAKNLPLPLVRSGSTLPSLSVRTRNKIPKFCAKKRGRPHLNTPLTVDVFYGRPLRKIGYA